MGRAAMSLFIVAGGLRLADHSDCRDQWRSARHVLEQRGGHSADGAIYG
jgi:hypothetical protein